MWYYEWLHPFEEQRLQYVVQQEIREDLRARIEYMIHVYNTMLPAEEKIVPINDLL